MALLAGRPLPGNVLPKISRVYLIEPVFMYASTIATLSATEYVNLHNTAQCSSANEYVILHNTAQRSSLNATFN